MNYPKPPFPDQQLPMPGMTDAMTPVPDHGETSYKGSGRLAGKKAVITGGDSGIGRAVAIAYAREGADVLISYLNEDGDARDTARHVEQAGRKAVLVAGDLQAPDHCRAVIAKAVSEFDGIDILVNNAAHQASFKSIEDISDEEWELTFKVNIHAMFYLTKAAVPHMKAGGCIINTASINSDAPNPTLLAYATTKGAVHNFTAGLAQMLEAAGSAGRTCNRLRDAGRPALELRIGRDDRGHRGQAVPVGGTGVSPSLENWASASAFWPGSAKQPIEFLTVLHRDKPDGEPFGQQPDHAADARPDGQRGAHRRLEFGGDGGPGGRHIDQEARMHGAVCQCQRRMGTDRNDAGILPAVANGRVFLSLLEPGELAGKPLAHGSGHLELEQEFTSPDI